MSLQNLLLNLLRHAPRSLLRKLAGPPLVIDGNELDVNVQIVANLAAKNPGPKPTTLEEYRRMGQSFDPAALPLVSTVAVADFEFSGPAGPLKVRSYTPSGVAENAPGILFFHQGGLVIMDHLTNNHFCSLLAQRCSAKVFSLDYRLCPEHEFPAPIEDALAFWDYVQLQASALGVDPGRIALAGDSAGGMISTALSHELRDRGGQQPVAVCLAYPWVSPKLEDQGSVQSCSEVFPMSRATMEFFNAMVFPSDKNIDHPWANPLDNPNLSGLPPAVVATGGLDPIRDQGNAYAEALGAAGNKVVHHCFASLPHSFLILGRVSKAAQQACNTIADDLKTLL